MKNSIEGYVTKYISHERHEDHADAITEAYLGVRKYALSYDSTAGDGKLSTWLFYGVRQGVDRILRQITKDNNLRKKSKVLTSAIHEVELEQERENLRSQIRQFIKYLRPYEQRIVELRAQGKKYPEIGELLGKKADAVRMTFNRAMKTLKTWLMQGLPEEFIKRESQPTIDRDWFKERLGKVVRKVYELGVFSVKSNSQPMLSRTRKKSRLVQIWQAFDFRLKKLFYPIDHFWYNKLTKYGRMAVLYATSLGMSVIYALSDSLPSHAQSCFGWLCGPFGVWTNSEFFNAIPGGQIALTFVFSAIQMFLLLIFAGIVGWAFYNGVKERSLTWPFIVAICYIAFLLITNYAGGLTVSQIGDNGVGFSEEAINTFGNGGGGAGAGAGGGG